MHLLISAHDHDAALVDEVRRAWPRAAIVRHVPQMDRTGLVVVEGISAEETAQTPLVFARQMLPDGKLIAAESVRAWTEQLWEAVIGVVPEHQPWRLHVVPHYGVSASPAAGARRCELIAASFRERLKQRRRRLWRSLHSEPDPFTPADSLVQLLLTSPDTGWLATAPAPWPYSLRRLVWPFPKGSVPLESDRAAPSRAFAKLLEAERRLGRRIAPGETCVDLGASPGSWSYVALQRGAQVTAVDRSPLREDLLRHPHLQFVRGDAFTFTPAAPVDWLMCDVIALPHRSLDLLLAWARQGWMRRFVVSIKFKGRHDYPQLGRLQAELPLVASEWFLVRLDANKNEACAFGVCTPHSSRSA